jgi:hypothetical protein
LELDLSEFPRLEAEGYEVKSEATPDYNCIAFAADDLSRRWSPFPEEDAYWPEGISRGAGVDVFVELYESFQYARCDNSDFEEGFEKIAIYFDAKESEVTHASKLIGPSEWTSKLGDWEDIAHKTLEALESTDYGKAVAFLKRKKP